MYEFVPEDEMNNEKWSRYKSCIARNYGLRTSTLNYLCELLLY